MPFQDRGRKRHLAKQVRADGSVMAACFKTQRPIDMTRATWTTDPAAVNCSMCRKVIAAGIAGKNLASEQLRILRHMLGIDDPYMREPRPWRDYYCANPGDPEMRALAEAGAVMLYDTRGGYEWWRCTEAGRAAAIESHGTIQHSKASRIYRKFLEVSDCRPDLTFRQFLTDPDFRRTRQEA